MRKSRKWIGIVLAGLLMVVSPCASLHAQGVPSGTVGWYNGDCQPGIPSQSNWYISSTSYSVLFDDFVVPDGGWTIAGVFAHSQMTSTGVTEAVWQIRSGMSVGNGGTLVAIGRNPATQTQTAATVDGSHVYLIQVNGLSLTLAPGSYWLSVAPVTANAQSYLCPTLGAGAIGNPPGNDGQAFGYLTGTGGLFTPAQATGAGGASGDFSLGVLLPVQPPASAWSDDVASLTQQIETFNSLPFPGIGLSDFNANAAALSSNSPTMTDAQIRTGIQALVASIEIPHTDLEWPYPPPFRYLPLSFYWFDDGIYITAAPEQYRILLGDRVVSVGRLSIDEATSKLTALVPHDNDSWTKYLIPLSKLPNTDFLFGTGVTDSTDSAQIQVSRRGDLRAGAGRRRPPPTTTASADVQALSPSQFPPMIQAYRGALPLYRQQPNKNYWATVIDGGATVYFQYNSCNEDPTLASADFLAQLNRTLAGNGVERLIVDMRNNTGGLATILDPWIKVIRSSRFNQPGRLYVIVGRATFSAAMEASDFFRDETAAIFVGEPTGGMPRFVLRRGDFGLPYFGIRVSYSSGVENAKDTDPTLVPDIQTGLTFEQYMNGDDPALDAILSIPPPQ